MNSLVADHYIRGLNGDTKFGRYFNYFGIRVLIWCEWDATETHTMLATVHFKFTTFIFKVVDFVLTLSNKDTEICFSLAISSIMGFCFSSIMLLNSWTNIYLTAIAILTMSSSLILTVGSWGPPLAITRGSPIWRKLGFSMPGGYLGKVLKNFVAFFYCFVLKSHNYHLPALNDKIVTKLDQYSG
jgi:hypothetical protein